MKAFEKIGKLFSTPKKALITCAWTVAILAAAGTGSAFAAEAVAESRSIGKEAAAQVAMSEVGVKPEETAQQRTDFDYEDGRYIFEVEFVSGDTEFDLHIDARDGKVLSVETERAEKPHTTVPPATTVPAVTTQPAVTTVPAVTTQPATTTAPATTTQPATTTAPATTTSPATTTQPPVTTVPAVTTLPVVTTQQTAPAELSIAEAKAIVLADAGIAAADAVFTEADYDTDDGVRVIDLEFVTATEEINYELDALTGAVRERSRELWHPAETSATAVPPVHTTQPPVTTQQTAPAELSLAEAKATALADAGVAAADAVFAEAKYDTDDGVRVIELEFVTATEEFDYELDAVTGAVRERSRELRRPAETFPTGTAPVQTTNPPPATAFIGVDKAKEIAAAHAGFALTDVTFSKAKLEDDDDDMVYEIEFYVGRTEYEYEIDAQTGRVLEFDSETDD